MKHEERDAGQRSRCNNGCQASRSAIFPSAFGVSRSGPAVLRISRNELVIATAHQAVLQEMRRRMNYLMGRLSTRIAPWRRLLSSRFQHSQTLSVASNLRLTLQEQLFAHHQHVRRTRCPYHHCSSMRMHADDWRDIGRNDVRLGRHLSLLRRDKLSS